MDLTNLTRDELLAYADSNGIALNKRMGIDTMRKRITEAEAKAVDVAAGTTSGTTRIIIAKSSEAAGGLPVTVTHNGVHTVIARGEPVDCPNHLVEQLDHAVAVTYSQGNGGEIIKREVQRYPYTRV